MVLICLFHNLAASVNLYIDDIKMGAKGESFYSIHLKRVI